MIPIEYATRKMGSIGLLLPNLEARIVVAEGNGDTDVEEGQPGELWIRGPTVMKVRFNSTLLSPVLIIPKAYLGNKAATHDAITPDGWFKTGDIATRDAEGFYYIVDRQKELIKYKVIDRSLVLWASH
jgi:4-coumarate--CoA ligase